jgi:hypothetical protein
MKGALVNKLAAMVQTKSTIAMAARVHPANSDNLCFHNSLQSIIANIARRISIGIFREVLDQFKFQGHVEPPRLACIRL